MRLSHACCLVSTVVVLACSPGPAARAADEAREALPPRLDASVQDPADERGVLTIVAPIPGQGFPCTGRGGSVICVRDGATFASAHTFVFVRLDLASGAFTVLGPASLVDEILRGPDGLYGTTADALYRLPREGNAVRVHDLPHDWESAAVVGPDVAVRRSTGSATEPRWTVALTQLGAARSHQLLELDGASTDGTLRAGGDRLEFTREGDPPTLLRWRRGETTFSAIPIAGASRGIAVHLVDEAETFLVSEAIERDTTGFTVFAVDAATNAVRVVSRVEIPAGSFRHAPYQIAADDEHLFYVAGRDATDSPVRIEKITKRGGQPTLVATFEEGGFVWTDGPSLFVSGGAGGTLYRTPR